MAKLQDTVVKADRRSMSESTSVSYAPLFGISYDDLGEEFYVHSFSIQLEETAYTPHNGTTRRTSKILGALFELEAPTSIPKSVVYDPQQRSEFANLHKQIPVNIMAEVLRKLF